MNAADYYGLEELRRACAGFVQCCINVDTVCALLASAERYIQYKCTKTLVQKVSWLTNAAKILVSISSATYCFFNFYDRNGRGISKPTGCVSPLQVSTCNFSKNTQRFGIWNLSASSRETIYNIITHTNTLPGSSKSQTLPGKTVPFSSLDTVVHDRNNYYFEPFNNKFTYILKTKTS